MKRHHTWFGNEQFAGPGGLVDENEDPIEAGIREVFEETGLAIDDLVLITTNTSAGNGRQFENYYYHTSNFTGTLLNKEPDRHSELDWYQLSSLPKETMPLVQTLIVEITQ